MNKKTILIGLITLLVLTGGVLYWKFTRSPRYSFLQIGRAVQNHDYALFEKYVDSENILNSSIDQVFEIIIANVDPGNVWGQFGQYFGAGLLNTFKPQLTVLYKKQIQDWIETGKVNNDSTHKELNSYSLPNLFSRQGAVSLKGIEYEVRDNQFAMVGLGLRLERFDTVLVFPVKMKNKGGYWQVAELMNLVAFQKGIDQLEEKRIDKINAPLEREMLNILKISNYGKSVEPVRSKENSNVKLNITFENTGNRTILEYGVRLTVSNLNHSLNQEIKINTESINATSEKIAPGKAETIVWPTDGTYSDNPKLHKLPINEIMISLSIRYIRFDDGTRLQLTEKWQPL